jgi:hypothetical protein
MSLMIWCCLSILLIQICLVMVMWFVGTKIFRGQKRLILGLTVCWVFLGLMCNIPHRKKSVQSQDILRQLVPNLVGRVLEPVGCQEQNHEAWKPDWAEPWRTIFYKEEWAWPYMMGLCSSCFSQENCLSYVILICFVSFLSNYIFAWHR